MQVYTYFLLINTSSTQEYLIQRPAAQCMLSSGRGLVQARWRPTYSPARRAALTHTISRGACGRHSRVCV